MRLLLVPVWFLLITHSIAAAQKHSRHALERRQEERSALCPM